MSNEPNEIRVDADEHGISIDIAEAGSSEDYSGTTYGVLILAYDAGTLAEAREHIDAAMREHVVPAIEASPLRFTTTDEIRNAIVALEQTRAAMVTILQQITARRARSN